MSRRLNLGTVALVACAVGWPPASEACAPATMRGVTVEVASESAIIIWDAKTKTQHFIRRATFTASGPGSTPVKDFGFLVPTPSVPVLEEADDRAFAVLARVTAPRVVSRPRVEGGGCSAGCGLKKSAPASAAPGGVEVLGAKSVAGYDAVILKSDDADALAKWLTDNGYESRPALTEWVKPYLAKKWVITAFKIAAAKDANPDAPIGASAVRMSFTTEQPFYPYREPEDMRSAKTPRLLRVYLIADQKMSGALESGAAWKGRAVWAGKPDAGDVPWEPAFELLKVPAFQPTAGTWLTEFEDRSSPRAGDADVVFAQAADQDEVERPVREVGAAPEGGANPAVAMLATAALCVLLTRALVGRVNRRA